MFWQPPSTASVSLFRKCVGTCLTLPRMGEGAWQRAQVNTERPIEPLQAGQRRAGRGRAGSGRWLRVVGRDQADRARARRPSWLGTCGQARSAVRAAAERAARQPRGSHEQRRQGPTAAPQPRSPAPPPALTMSICCCFFFRDYGSSKRKSGKGASGCFLHPPLLLRARASPALRRTFGGRGGVLACLTRGPAGPGFFPQWPCCPACAPQSSAAFTIFSHRVCRALPCGNGGGCMRNVGVSRWKLILFLSSPSPRGCGTHYWALL